MASLATADSADESAKPSADSYAVSSIDRAIDILEAFSLRTPELGLKEISLRTGLHKATAFRLLAGLCRRGLVIKHPTTGAYRLGFQLIGMAEIAKARGGLVAEALPIMRRLRDSLEETIFLSVRAGDFRIDVEQVESLQTTRRVLTLGEQKSLHAGAASKLLLAGMGDGEIEDYLGRADLVRFTETTLTDAASIRREVARVRAQNYADGWDERNSGGAGAAAPIFGPSGELVGAISVAILISRCSDALRHRAADAVTEAASEISRNLGAPPTANLVARR